MNPKQALKLAQTLRTRRGELGLSASEVARRAEVAKATVTRLELGDIPQPRPDNLRAIAEALELPVADLFAAADWIPEGELPTLTPYLRTKYKDMPADAVREIEQHFAAVAQRHGLTLDHTAGPSSGQDE
ncbi:helix-turn-helix domain-containing protein [Rhodococcus chondri]|uniref:Helix-turn-helix transcriptional regulator n=1 Tax=Rhodococcus chondri TaxID=3065941 RepID=A0ABU7JUL6_9NOCA|nr:helix-turn-helix transcriptional regulator [Rhodococcus sp. CC-R104]MEE2032982.1 helix-turn-helix transcriptional regulator [Rhodococcus sp. CC-R104]